VGSLALALGGCLTTSGPARPDPKAVAGPIPYVENCATCHAGPIVAHYAGSRHEARGIRCGQCHTGGGHPEFSEPVRDSKCGGCHQAQYQQTLASKHFARRVQLPLDGDRAARAALRREGFTAATATGRAFVGDSSSGPMGGRLCAACHYDEHRLGRGPVQQPTFCATCHADRAEHFAGPANGGQNRCFGCHVRVGTTVAGQVVNTHRFAVPGAAEEGR
jgi:hypothetical protein